MSWSFPIGRLFGSELRVHATFFLLLLWIGVAAYANAGMAAAIHNVAFILVLFACVIAHEFGHALTARRFGIRTPDVTLLPIGGLARMEKMPEKPGQEIAVALAGPMVNVVIWLVLMVFGASTDAAQLGELGTDQGRFLSQIATLNLFLAVFNLLPAFPMDGGRVLRAVLSIFMDRVRATSVAARTGQVLAFGMGFVGFTTGNFMLIFIAFFIFMSAGAESSDVAMRAVARGMMARDAMITEFESLRPEDSIALAANALIRTTQHEFPVLYVNGDLAGFLTRAALFTAMANEDRQVSVGETMARDIPIATLTDGLEKVLERMQGGAPAIAVTGKEGKMIGYITRENIGELMVIANSRATGTA